MRCFTLKNQTNTVQDQAEQLKQIVQELNTNASREKSEDDNHTLGQDKIDILDLPPRKTIHVHKNKILKIKMRRPLVRFLIVIIVPISIIFILYYFWQDDLLKLISNL